MRGLQWVFSGSGGEAVIDAETGAVIFVGYSMGGGSQRSVAASPSPSSPPVSGAEGNKPDKSSGVPWIWGLAIIPVAVGAWLIVRARG